MQIHIVEKIKLALSKALDGKSLDNISINAKLREDLGLDSMSSLTFLMTLEELIQGFSVDPETLEAKDLESIATVSSYVEARINS